MLAALLAGACSDAVAPVVFDAPVDLTLSWRTSTPAATGMDEGALARADEMANAIPRLRSLLVVRRGRLVHERYWAGATAAETADVRSVTKSILSTLVGIALERGDLTGVDETLGEIVPADALPLSLWERDIRVGDLLTMSGGWDWEESGAVGYNEWITSEDPVAFLLSKPKASEPGTAFAYNSAAVHLLGVVLEEAIGTTVPRFADEVLFGPLGIGTRVWEPLAGHVNGGAGIDLRPRDLARIGQLYLQDGWSGDRRILPEGWVRQATTPRWGWVSDAGPTHVSYGWLWWIDVDHHAYFAWGYGGQFVYVAPERDLVVVATTHWGVIDGQSTPPGSRRRCSSVIVKRRAPGGPEGLTRRVRGYAIPSIFCAFLRWLASRMRLRSRMASGVTSMSSSSSMNSSASSSVSCRGGSSLMFSSDDVVRMFVSFFSLLTFTSMSSVRTFSPTIMPAVDGVAGADEHRRALLEVEEREAHGHALAVRHQHAPRASPELAGPRAPRVEVVVQDPLAAGVGQELGAVAEEPARRDAEAEARRARSRPWASSRSSRPSAAPSSR